MGGDALLDDVLVLTVRKGFWASAACEIFPHRLYTPTLRGPSHSLVNSGLLALCALVEIRRRRPRVVLIGYAHRIAPWFAALRRLHIVRARLVITNKKGLRDDRVRYVDRIIEYSRGELELRPPEARARSVFMPLPAPGDFDGLNAVHAEQQPYIFSGGGGLRDFASLIEAVRGTRVRLLIVTFSPETLGYEGELPPNCEVRWRVSLQEFLRLMAGSSFVVAALRPGPVPHGQTAVVQALRLGKALVATRDASLDDYVADGREGLLVDAGDVAGYRAAIDRLLDDDDLRASCERHAREHADALTYETFATGLAALCREVIAE